MSIFNANSILLELRIGKMKLMKVGLILLSIIGSIIGSCPAEAESSTKNVCQQMTGENSSSEITQLILDDESFPSDTNALTQLAANLGLARYESRRWTCKYIKNEKWYGLLNISLQGETRVIASTFLINGKFKPRQKDAALSFLTEVTSEILLLGEENQKKVKEALAGYLDLIDEGIIIPNKLEQDILLQKLETIGITLNEMISSIPDGWLSDDDDAIPLERLVIFDGGGRPQAVAYAYMLPIVDLEEKEIIEWGINVIVEVTAKEKFEFPNPSEPETVNSI